MTAFDPSLTPFFNPRGVVLIGASREPAKLGYGLARNLVRSGYPGAIHFVNPKGGQLFGREIYRQVQDVPDPVDLAVILAPAGAVPAALDDCGKRGIKAAIIVSGGFRETGAQGAALEAECLKVAGQYSMRLIGPNCIGLIDTHLPLDTTFLQPPGPQAGEIAFISHSGATCAVIVDWIAGQGIGLSRLISLGNQVDVNETDMLAAVGADDQTRVLTLYLEGVSDGRRFIEEARQVVQRKPVVALKVGRSESGRKAAASHTGALAGAETAFEAAFRKAGVLRAKTTEQLIQWAKVLAWCPLPKGPRVAVLTNAGGPGVTAADAIEEEGLQLAHISETTRTALSKLLPSAASVHNPVDMLASASPEVYSACLEVLLADEGVDSVMVLCPPPPAYSAGWVAKLLIPIIQSSEKPVIVVMMGERLIQEGVAFLRAVEIVEFRFAEIAASALGALWKRMQYLQLPQASEEKVEFPEGLRKWVQSLPDGWLDAAGVTELFNRAGLPILQTVKAGSADAAAKAAERLVYPVVMKIDSPDILHKSDVGGVLLNLHNAEAVREGYDTVMQRARAARPEARLDGVLLQQMAGQGQEVIAGMVRDPQFGPMMMFGLGGTEVEGLKDVAFELAPLNSREADSMLAHTWAGRKLDGFRNIPAADRQAVQAVLVRLSQLAMQVPELAEVEINPLCVLAPGSGALAIDVRVRKGG
jgi:acetyl coenzyme A synthetase (ADP forming)-like protein